MFILSVHCAISPASVLLCSVAKSMSPSFFSFIVFFRFPVIHLWSLHMWFIIMLSKNDRVVALLVLLAPVLAMLGSGMRCYGGAWIDGFFGWCVAIKSYDMPPAGDSPQVVGNAFAHVFKVKGCVLRWAFHIFVYHVGVDFIYHSRGTRSGPSLRVPTAQREARQKVSSWRLYILRLVGSI